MYMKILHRFQTFLIFHRYISQHISLFTVAPQEQAVQYGIVFDKPGTVRKDLHITLLIQQRQDAFRQTFRYQRLGAFKPSPLCLQSRRIQLIIQEYKAFSGKI